MSIKIFILSIPFREEKVLVCKSHIIKIQVNLMQIAKQNSQQILTPQDLQDKLKTMILDLKIFLLILRAF